MQVLGSGPCQGLLLGDILPEVVLMLQITLRQKRLAIGLVFTFPELAPDGNPESKAVLRVAVRMGPPSVE